MVKKKKALSVVDKFETFLAVLPKGFDEFNKLPTETKLIVSEYCYALISTGGIGNLTPIEALCYSLKNKKSTKFIAHASDEIYICTMMGMVGSMAIDFISLLQRTKVADIHISDNVKPN